MKILAVVLSYYPDMNLINENVSAFVDCVDKVLIWENTPEVDKLRFRYINHPKVEYCGDGVNSISRGLNYAWKYAKVNGYGYLLTMDQDSCWVDFPKFLSKTVKRQKTQDCVWGPSIVGRDDDSELHLGDVITSGMLVPVSILNEVGGYYEEFKVDGIDAYFCYSAMEHGYPVYRVGGCALKQNFGNLSRFSIGGLRFFSYQYNAYRIYEIYKSQIIILRRFKTTREYKHNFWYNRIFKWPFKIILCEKSKVDKMKAMVKGIMAGLSYKIERS